ncbi:reprolysin-like metallopeptidase [Legionella sp. D16C41]|uniref:reprolysin-like metallopeptidase n=1 Tax=Legionella sp. D16C41 TaxID=3402688 RepID=UPI003AF416C5
MARMSTGAVLFLFFPSLFAAEQPTGKIIQTVTKELKSFPLSNQFQLSSNHYRIVEMDINHLYAELEHVQNRDDLTKTPPLLIKLPQPDGTTHTYEVRTNSTMHPKLAAQFPEIKTFDGYSIDDSGELVKFDITPHGFHAMILSPDKNSVFIDPVEKGNTQTYIVYNKKDFITKRNLKCNVSGQQIVPLNKSKNFINFASCELRRYRLALAATAQYTAYFGGTVPMALAAEVTTMNRVNGIYERDIAVTMQIIPNNTSIIYTNPAAQPYTSGNTELLLPENQVNLDTVIGSGNYDIGHVVDASNGNNGLAALASVCNPSEKAEGATTFNNPIGDPFDVDYVAHEMGHQFGANHTQNNNCNRYDPTAVEPGSGSTIMGYAGICAPNVQKYSNSYFNGISLQEIGNFISSPTHTCAVKIPIPAAPVIKLLTELVIPANTPFLLTAIANNGTNSRHLTYTWEQMDNEVSPQPPSSEATGGPNFRSFSPSLNLTRFFPRLTALANGGPFTWEVLPAVSRTMNFRVSVRTNRLGGSCNAYRNARVIVDANAGPFVVTAPATGTQWAGNTWQVVTWQVANTNLPPINASLVNMLLSVDGGNTYPYVVAKNLPNTGIGSVFIPNIATPTARLMVIGANGVSVKIVPNSSFFNISGNFSILPSAIKLTKANRNTRKSKNVTTVPNIL